MLKPIILATFLVAGLVSVPTPAYANCDDMIAETGKPTHLTDGNDNIELCRLGYFISYDPVTQVSDWVQERLEIDHLSGPARRRDNFKTDPNLPDGSGPSLSDYRGSGYDRGHMAPAGNMTWSQQAMNESFYLTNMAPQVGRGFNRGVWRALETQIRDWVEGGRSPLVVATGPVYGHEQHVIGDGVVVPALFYKIVYDPTSKTAIGFLLANKVADFRDYKNRIVAIDAIESLTGIDFLTGLSEAEQERLESKAAKLWDD